MMHTVTVQIPCVPHGPDGVAPKLADAGYYEEAARNIRHAAGRGQLFAGSNLTESVARLCESVALALRASYCPCPECAHEPDEEGRASDDPYS